jgi:hypothetical protein
MSPASDTQQPYEAQTQQCPGYDFHNQGQHSLARTPEIQKFDSMI